MSKRILFIVLLAASGFCNAFERPWDDPAWVASNPNIFVYGVQFWWNLPEFSKALQSFDPGMLQRSGINGTAEQSLEEAGEWRKDAYSKQEMCIYDVLGGVGVFPLDPSYIFFKAFGSSSSCVAYSRSWKAAVDSVLDSAEESISEAESSLVDARDAYSVLEFSGLCLENYSGPGSQDCPELISAFLAIDGNVSEGKYGKHAALLSYSSSLQDNLGQPVPDLSPAATILSIVWEDDGFISSMEGLEEKAGDALSQGDSEFHSLAQSARGRKADAEKMLGGMESAGYGRISRGVESSGMRDPGAIGERFDALKLRASSLSLQLDDGSLEHGRVTKRHYLAGSIMLMQGAEDGYVSLLESLKALDEDARETVSQQRAVAEEEILLAEEAQSMPSTDSISLLSESKDELEEGDTAAEPGDAFTHYSRAASLARSSSSSGSLIEEAGARVSLSSLEDIILRAEKDGIDVAFEKEDLALIRKIPAPLAGEEAERAIGSILSKARVKYEDSLAASRSRLAEKISLAGPGAADLMTDLQNSENGLIENGSLVLPASIGHLAKLQKEFSKIEEEVDAYMGSIVGNSFSVSASPIVLSAKIDEQSLIILDVVLANDHPYNATDVVARVRMPSRMDFLYSDISSDREGVESLRMEDDGKALAIVLSKVSAYETKRLTLEKEAVIARTIRRNISAVGIGGGAAHVSERLAFSLDYPVGSLSLPPGLEGAAIDGSVEPPSLAPGNHSLRSERTVEDAYTEEIHGIKTYAIGTNSKVEVSITITPAMDLESVPVIIDSLNDSRIKSFEVVPSSGNKLSGEARLSDTQYSFVLHGLEKGRNASARISYLVEDTESFVKERLEFINPSNLSGAAKDLLDKAYAQAEGGNYSKALEFLEQSISRAEQDKKDEEKTAARCDSELSGLKRELENISSVLPSSGPPDPFFQKLDSRKTELERLLNESAAGDGACLEALSGYDSSWLGKEMSSFKKTAYTSYNDLKERLFRTGNVSTPPEFIGVEGALAKVETGPRLEYAAALIASLRNATVMVAAQEAAFNSSRIVMKSALESTGSAVEAILQRYTAQASAAKGTDYSGIFNESSKNVEKLLKEAEAAAAGDPRIFWSKLADLNNSGKRMESTLIYLEGEAESRISMLERLIGEGQYEAQAKASFSEKLSAIRRSADSGDYVNSLRSASSLAKEIDQKKPADNTMILIGVTAFAVLGGLALYIMREKPKKMRKLPSMDPADLLQEPSDSQSRK